MGKQVTKELVGGVIATLDPNNDAHWTKAGKPDMGHICAVTNADVTRKDLDTLGFGEIDRDNAPLIDPPQAHALEAQDKAGEAVATDGEPDAIALIEAFVAACQTDRFRRNSELQALSRQWQVQQHAARTLQGRLDKRMSDRAKAKAQA